MIILNLTRGKSSIRVPLRLPATPADVGVAYAKLDQISPAEYATRISSVISEVTFLDRFFRDMRLDALDDLNALAEKVNSMTEQEKHTFDGALNAESINGVRSSRTAPESFICTSVTVAIKKGSAGPASKP